MNMGPRRTWLLLAIAALVVGLLAPAATAHPDPGEEGPAWEDVTLEVPDLNGALEEYDEITDVISSEPSAKVVKNLDLRGLGARPETGATTDVWVHGNLAYTGTSDEPCGGEPEAGIWTWDVTNPNEAELANIVPSERGDRTNDVKVAAMNSGDIMVMSNESCDDGNGGFQLFNVDDPENPVELASVLIDELAQITPFFFAPGALEEVGVHNLFLFTQDEKDYVAAQAEGIFDGFRIYDITDPTNPTLMSGWGAEELFDPGVGDLTLADDPTGSRTLAAILWMLGIPPFDGFGDSGNRLLHDFTISADGTKAYLAHWDAGLILLDISDVTAPQVISVALDPANGSLDNEVNSHSVWPSEDGTIVVEGEEDFAAWNVEFIPPGNLSMQGVNTIPAVAVSTNAGDQFEANQTGNSGTVTAEEVAVTAGPLAGTTFPATEFVLNNAPLGDGSISGEFVWVGRACDGDPLVNPISSGDIAVVRRGDCFFSDKESNVAAAGAAAIVVANNERNSPWSGLRIWDYSDPENPILASTFNTECSIRSTVGGPCDPAGTYSAHNVIVESTGKTVKAYVSWYSEGILVLDVTDPYNPVEIGRFLDNSVNENDEPNNFWGVYKVPKDPFIYGSDRNGGLYIFKEQGSGSGK